MTCGNSRRIMPKVKGGTIQSQPPMLIVTPGITLFSRHLKDLGARVQSLPRT
jgi:hypothetical protein